MTLPQFVFFVSVAFSLIRFGKGRLTTEDLFWELKLSKGCTMDDLKSKVPTVMRSLERNKKDSVSFKLIIIII